FGKLFSDSKLVLLATSLSASSVGRILEILLARSSAFFNFLNVFLLTAGFVFTPHKKSSQR
ncbi:MULTISPECIES: hypothetical protein, partial [Pseudidiomarina]|uniref:hypothetical protein n=1 Tax=Pseudidiomarina TaxID=2800384 RepID=UPI001C63BEDF